MESLFDELTRLLAEVLDLQSTSMLLYWDQTTQQPARGAAARGRASAALTKVIHERFTAPRIGKLLDRIKPANEFQQAVLRVTRRRYERAIRLPADFSARCSAHQSTAYQAWLEAREANDFMKVAPVLEKTLDLSLEHASYFPECEHPADASIDGPDPGMTAAAIREVFSELRNELVPHVDAFCELRKRDDAILHQPFDRDAQLAFSRKVAAGIGYDFERGRLDLTAHPFMARLALDDARITTRVDDNFLGDCLYSTIHEVGHALYELGLSRESEHTMLAGGVSAGVHESQSRLWENMVGRSREFWQYWLPEAQGAFPQLAGIDADGMYEAVNTARRSQIRTEADELTYNLHVMIRFDLELAMLEGKLGVADLRDAWNARYESDLGLTPDSDRNGVLQDVHWFHGGIGGMFQGYTLGNIMAAQFYEAALAAHPDIPAEIATGNYSLLHGYLRQEIYQHGKTYLPDELVQRVTGKPLSIAPYMRYLHRKFPVSC
jgi:carboxypeptidase Taq